MYPPRLLSISTHMRSFAGGSNQPSYQHCLPKLRYSFFFRCCANNIYLNPPLCSRWECHGLGALHDARHQLGSLGSSAKEAGRSLHDNHATPTQRALPSAQ